VPLAPLPSTATADEGSPRQLPPSPDRSAHPAGRDLLGASKIRPTGSISFGALRRIAAGLARVQQPVPLDHASDAARSVRLLATAFYDVWLITWPDGSGLEPHDHGNARSVVHVVEGELTEVFSDRVRRSEPAARILRQGSSTPAAPSVVHALTNRSGADATTLHVYSPPLVDVTFFDLGSADSCEALRSTAVIERAAQATSKEMAPLGPAPLILVDP
jgi:predicted metal-dependent enzyme (double-stranded beta helix superfamily)